MSANASAWMTALGNGSQGAGISALGQGASAFGSVMQGKTARILAQADADSERYAAGQVATQARRNTRQVAGAFKTATAASGAALDEFGMAGLADIEHRGAHDEAMAILSGESKAIAGLARGKMDSNAAYQQAAGSLLKGASYAGWKGAKEAAPKYEWYDG